MRLFVCPKYFDEAFPCHKCPHRLDCEDYYDPEFEDPEATVGRWPYATG